MTVAARHRALRTSAAAILFVMLAACITQQAGNTALIQAAWDGDSSKVQALLRAGADVNASNREGLTALMASTWGGRGTGDAGIAKALIARGR
jgi:ankyrin repeat protein